MTAYMLQSNNWPDLLLNLPINEAEILSNHHASQLNKLPIFNLIFSKLVSFMQLLRHYCQISCLALAQEEKLR